MIQELRAPLVEIVGFSDVIKRSVPGENRRLAQAIQKNGSQLIETLVSVLDLIKVESGSIGETRKRVDIAAQAREILEEYRPEIRRRGLWLKFIDPEIPVEADLDPAALRIILSAVLSNAIRFSTMGGVTIGVHPQDGYGDVIITDTGCGISPAFLSSVFDAFAREDVELAEIRQGSGLGLTIAKRVIDELGGEIEITSVRGQGTTCRIRLPARCRHSEVRTSNHFADDREAEVRDRYETTLSTRNASAAVPRSSHTGDANSSTKPPARPAGEITEKIVSNDRPYVLLVEDNLVTRRVMEMMLCPDYNLVAVAEVDQALSIAETYQFDLLLLDIALNERRTGVEVLHAIRKMEGYEKVPAIACTAYSVPGIKDRYLEAGFTGYIAKPFRKEQLLELIDTVMSEGVRMPSDTGVKETTKVDLPPLPQTLTSMLDLVSDENRDERADELNEILAGDPVVSSWVLRHANSAFYSVRGNVSSVERAVTLLGLEPICNLVVAQVLAQTFSTNESGRCRNVYDHILKNSVATAAYARSLAAETGLENPDIVFTAGLIHDVGRLCLLSTWNENYSGLWYAEEDDGFAAPTIGQELMKFGIDHQLMGIDVSKEWDLPVNIDQVIRHYWEPATAAVDFRRAVFAVAAGRAAAQVYVVGGELSAPDASSEDLDSALLGLVNEATNDAVYLRELLESRTEEVRTFVETLVQA